jgi:hypothetical protein
LIITFFLNPNFFWRKLQKISKNCRKLSKIAENCDHNIEPRPADVQAATLALPSDEEGFDALLEADAQRVVAALSGHCGRSRSASLDLGPIL